MVRIVGRSKPTRTLIWQTLIPYKEVPIRPVRKFSQHLIWLLLLIFIFSVFPPQEKVEAAAPTTSLMVYDTDTVSGSIAYYRTWNGSAWSAESVLAPIVGQVRFQVVKYSPTSNQAIWVVQGSGGDVAAAVWDGTAWGPYSSLGNVGSANAASRGFDVEYEKTSGDALVVLSDNTNDPDYYTYTSGSWSGPTNLDTGSASAGIHGWIELSSNPTSSSNEIAIITLDTVGDVYGCLWTGSAIDCDWDNSGSPDASWDTLTASSTGIKKYIDVAHEKTSGDIMFIWADSVATDQQYRTYSGGTLSGNTLLDIAASGGVGDWVKLETDPTSSSDSILYTVQDAGADLNTRKWSGTAWDTATQHAEHSAAIESITNRVYDIQWEYHGSHANKAWLIYGNGATVSRKLMTVSGGTASWGAATTYDDDTHLVQASASPGNGAIVTAHINAAASTADDIESMNRSSDGSTWAATADIWTGATVDPGYEETDVDCRRDSGNDCLMVYAKEATITGMSTPKWREWTGSWGAENSTNLVPGSTITQYRIECTRIREECILVTQSSRQDIAAQIWNGTNWGTPEILRTSSLATNSPQRVFDVQYEYSSGDAVIAYGDGTVDMDYAIWNGTTWSKNNNLDINMNATAYWVDLAQKRTSGTDELALIVLDHTTTNGRVFGCLWTGSAFDCDWDNSGAPDAAWDTVAGQTDDGQSVQVEYETTSGDAMFMWCYDTIDDIGYRTYSGGTLSGENTLNIPAMDGVNGQFTRLKANPASGSNDLLFGVQDSASDLNTRRWNGSSWDTATEHPEHTAAVELTGNHTFDIIWETHSSNPDKAWLAWGDGTTADATTTSHKSGSVSGGVFSWGGSGTLAGDDTGQVVMHAQPASGAVFRIHYQGVTSLNDDIMHTNLTGGGSSWAAEAQIWAGPITTVVNLGRVDLASELYDPDGGASLTVNSEATAVTLNPGSAGETTADYTFSTSEEVIVDSTATSAWTLSAAATNFTSGANNISNARFFVGTNAATTAPGVYSTTGTGTFAEPNNGYLALSSTRTLLTLSSGSGTVQAVYRPTVYVQIPVIVVSASDYSSTITFTVI